MNSPTPNPRLVFERLCLYRELYARRGPQDRVAVIGVGEQIRRIESLLALPSAPALQAG
jgi:hypothetical protein